MFRTIRRIIRWCGDFRKRLYISFFFSFLSGLSAAAPAIYAGYIIGKVVQWRAGDFSVPSGLWLQSLGVIFATILLRFLLDYMKARFQETISYELVARDRLAIGTALKRVSLGYFQEKDTGTVLNSITTGLYTLENMGMRMIDTFVGGYLSFFLYFYPAFCHTPLWCIYLSGGCPVVFSLLISYFKVQQKKYICPDWSERKTDKSGCRIYQRIARGEIVRYGGSIFLRISKGLYRSKKDCPENRMGLYSI